MTKKGVDGAVLTQVELFLVLQSRKPGFEVFITEGAFERPVLAVQDHVLLQVRLAGEGLETDLVQSSKVGFIHHYHHVKLVGVIRRYLRVILV